MSKRLGLPTAVRMRHDSHFVEELATQQTDAVGRMIPTDQIKPNPHQPRQMFADLDELVASIQRVGVLEPLLVRRAEEGYQIISGERRYRASCMADLEELPCIVLEVDDARALEIALIENLQREDLSPFEESEGLQALVDQFGFTHEEVAHRISKSRPAVTEILSLGIVPRPVRNLLEESGIRSRSLLLEISRCPEEQMEEVAQKVITDGLTRDDVRKLRRSRGKQARQEQSEQEPPVAPRRLTFRSKNGVTISVYLGSEQISLADVERSLMEAIRNLRSNGIPPVSG